MTTAAQDEYNALFADHSRSSHHPADASSDDDDDSDSSVTAVSERTQKASLRGSTLNSYRSTHDDEDEDADEPSPPQRSSTYYLPDTYNKDANTGPKGVIADAQAFEREKRGRASTFKRTEELKLPTAQVPVAIGVDGRLGKAAVEEEEEESEEKEDDEIMRKWRERRIAQLRKDGFIGEHVCRASKGRGSAGLVEVVDGMGFLNAVDSAPRGVAVVVYIFEENSTISAAYHDHLKTIAQKYTQAKFIALSYLDAEMDLAGVPALLAYRDGEKFADMIPLRDEVPFTCNVVTNLEEALKWHGIIN